MNSDGSVAQTVQASIPAHGVAVQEINNGAGYVDVFTDSGLLAGFVRISNGRSLASLNGQNGSMPSNRLVGPHFVSGYLGNLRMDTQIFIVNPSGASTLVTLRLLDEKGQELAKPVVRSINGGAQLSSSGWELFGLPDPLSTTRLTMGTVLLESEQGLIGAMTFGDPVAGRYLSALPLMSSRSAKREIFFGHVAVGLLGDIDYFTGIALVNASTAVTANVDFELYDSQGKLVAGTGKPFALGPNGRTAQLVQQLIPDFRGSQFGGFIHLV